MRIIDSNGNTLDTFNPDVGYLVGAKWKVAHHAEIIGVPEEGHFEVGKEYPNGGQDLVWVVDILGVDPVPAWDEYEDVMRFVPYTDDELAAMEIEKAKPSKDEQIRELQEALDLLLTELVK